MLDHEAIRKAYPDVVTIKDDTGAFKADGTKITLVQSNIDAARVESTIQEIKNCTAMQQRLKKWTSNTVHMC